MISAASIIAIRTFDLTPELERGQSPSSNNFCFTFIELLLFFGNLEAGRFRPRLLVGKIWRNWFKGVIFFSTLWEMADSRDSMKERLKKSNQVICLAFFAHLCIV